MDLQNKMVATDTITDDVLNFDDYIPPFYIKNSSKGHLIEFKIEEFPQRYDNIDYIQEEIDIKQELDEMSQNVSDLITTHRKEKPYKCEHCFYSFKSKYNLLLHQKTHNREKKFACNLCGYRAILATTIKKHLIIHTNSDKAYKCSLCDFQTMYKHSLQFHMKRHTGEKPFECSLCDYKTIQKANLAFHMRHHNGTKYFNCALCEYKTTNKSYLEIHHMKHRDNGLTYT